MNTLCMTRYNSAIQDSLSYPVYLNFRSEEWNKIDKSSREKIGLTFDDDGEFWRENNLICAVAKKDSNRCWLQANVCLTDSKQSCHLTKNHLRNVCALLKFVVFT